MAAGWQKDYTRYRNFFLNIIRLYSTKPNLKIYLELVLSIVTVVIFAAFAIKPTVLTILELNKQIQEKEQTVAKLKEKIKSLQTASSLLQSQATKLLLIEEAVPSKANPDILVRQMESIAVSNSVQITGFSASEVNLVGKPPAKAKSKDENALTENADALPFTVTVTGSYQNLFAFLRSIEGLRRPVKIDSLAFNSTVSDNGKVLTLSITGRVPYLYAEVIRKEIPNEE